MTCLAKDPAERWQSADDLLAQLELVTATPSGGTTPTHTRPVQGIGGNVPPRKRPAFVIPAAIATLLVLGAGVWFIRRSRGSEGIQRIGVMPIEDISGKDSVFVAAMQDALTNALSRLGTVGVASRSEMMRYRGTPKTDREVASELKLDALVEATVFRAGDIMRVNVQFSDPATTRSLWASTYNRDVSNVLAAQDTVVGYIQRGVDSVLAGTKKSGATK